MSDTTKNVLELIKRIRIQLDEMENEVCSLSSFPAKKLTLEQWLDSKDYPRERTWRSILSRSDELFRDGYSFEEVTKILKLRNKRRFLELLQRFHCDRGWQSFPWDKVSVMGNNAWPNGKPKRYCDLLSIGRSSMGNTTVLKELDKMMETAGLDREWLST